MEVKEQFFEMGKPKNSLCFEGASIETQWGT
jgi:hypothetical protein